VLLWGNATLFGQLEALSLDFYPVLLFFCDAQSFVCKKLVV